MKWEKKGVIFKSHGQYEWMAHHACIPVADKINDEIIRIYFAPRNNQNCSLTTFIEVLADNPTEVIYVHHKPILELGKLGSFDDSGVMPSSIVNHKGRKYLYYIGWNRGVTVPYRNSVGLAISDDGGVTFQRVCEGPVLDRTQFEPYFCASPFVIFDDDQQKWKIWYASSTGWVIVHDKLEPQYKIKYAESHDGINWIRNNITCIPYTFEGEANARPCVVKENGSYKMWFCFRGSVDYRKNKDQSYRLGYAESLDGISWVRKDDEVGIDRSENGWDSEMIEYPYIYNHKGVRYMLYNGNGFGETGFGYAILTN